MSILSKPIVVVGSINIDLVANTQHIPSPGQTVSGFDFQVHPGGKGANQAVAVARLGCPVHLIGRVGNDDFGSQLRNHLALAGVELSALMTSKGPSGVAVIVVAQSGENSIVVVPGANTHLSPQDLDDNIELIRSAGIVLTQLETPLKTVMHLATLCYREGISFMLDPAPARSLPLEIIKKVTWFTPNETEATFFVKSTPDDAPPSMAQALLDNGWGKVLLKLGARGAYVATADGIRAAVKPFPVVAIDTTAAGDCFNGAFASALCMGRDPLASADFAAAAAAIAVTRLGAQPSMPTAREVQSLLDGVAPPPSGSSSP